MNLFSADLFRHFGIGFLAGAVIVIAATIGQWAPQIESPASAAVPLETPASSAEFVIEPLEVSQ